MKNFQARLQQPDASAEVNPIKATSVAWEATKGLFRGKS